MVEVVESNNADILHIIDQMAKFKGSVVNRVFPSCNGHLELQWQFQEETIL